MSEPYFRIPHEDWGTGWKAGPVHTLLRAAQVAHAAEVERRLKAALDAHFGEGWTAEDVQDRVWHRETREDVTYWIDSTMVLRIEL